MKERTMNMETYEKMIRGMRLEDFIAELLERAEDRAVSRVRFSALLEEAAKRLAELDERIAIMSEPKCGEDACDIVFDGEEGE